MKPLLLLATLTAALGLTTFAAKPVELIRDRQPLDPTTTFEIRFAEPMVAPDAVGKNADSPPVAFRPAIKGHFTWLSERSGILVPDEPLPLGTTLQLGLAPGIMRADGKPLEADFREIVQTPPMHLKGWHSHGYLNAEDASPRPKLALLFNANVEPATAGRFCKFADKSGNEIAAHVERADASDENERHFPLWKSSDSPPSREIRRPRWQHAAISRSSRPSNRCQREKIGSSSWQRVCPLKTRDLR
jgi:hypothetical protein